MAPRRWGRSISPRRSRIGMASNRWSSPVSAERALPRGWPDAFGLEGDDRQALLALATLRGTEPRAVHALAWRCGSAGGCLARIRSGRSGSDGDREHLRDLDLTAVDEALAACGARFVGPHDEEYPSRLLDLHDPPCALFVRGRPLRQDHDRVSIVGSRGASTLGVEVAHELGRC